MLWWKQSQYQCYEKAEWNTRLYQHVSRFCHLLIFTVESFEPSLVPHTTTCAQHWVNACRFARLLSLVLFTFFASSVRRVHFLLQCRVSTVISVASQLPGDSGQAKQCLFLFWLTRFHPAVIHPDFVGKIKHSVNEKSRFSWLKLDSCPKGYITVIEASSVRSAGWGHLLDHF